MRQQQGGTERKNSNQHEDTHAECSENSLHMNSPFMPENKDTSHLIRKRLYKRFAWLAGCYTKTTENLHEKIPLRDGRCQWFRRRHFRSIPKVQIRIHKIC